MTDLRTPGSHPFNQHLNERLCAHGFDDFVEAQCAGSYAETMVRPGFAPGIDVRLLLIGYFEGIDAEQLERSPRHGRRTGPGQGFSLLGPLRLFGQASANV